MHRSGLNTNKCYVIFDNDKVYPVIVLRKQKDVLVWRHFFGESLEFTSYWADVFLTSSAAYSALINRTKEFLRDLCYLRKQALKAEKQNEVWQAK